MEDIEVGDIFGVKTQEGRYGIFQLTGTTAYPDTASVTVNWIYQPDGSRRFK